ncbi:electron transfer flavoprotein-ubiquinone oxidoreductase [bacterium]|nr:electron transfer flavoprotein-ubiquinone oxidoreductase [bacterium]
MEREVLEMDVLFIGGGPANLVGALHLKNLINKHNEEIKSGKKTGKKLDEIFIGILEKAAEIGAHGLSGGVLDPKAMNEFMPDWKEQNAPVEAPCKEDEILFLTKNGKLKFPVTPPPMENHGNFIISLNKFTKWLGEKCEENAIDIFAGFPAKNVLLEGKKVVGVQTSDAGIDKNGNQKRNFQPGMEIRSKVTVLGEGPRGTLTKVLTKKLKLEGMNPQTYATGVKEVWKMPEGRIKAGKVIHTMGEPLDEKDYGGGFIYGMANDLLAVGFVVGLDYKNPQFDPHRKFQEFKNHPEIRKILEGGEVQTYGAKTIPMGSWYSMPKYFGDGFLIVGDSASFLNPQRLKGIHLAMKSGMLAAETILESLLCDDFSEKQLSNFQTKVENSWIKTEMFATRNFHQGFEKGLWHGMFNAGIQLLTNGRGLRDKMRTTPDHTHVKKLSESSPLHTTLLKFDEKVTFDKLKDVYFSGALHEEDQPSHLLIADTNICNGICKTDYGNPCQYFCPAQVYEIETNSNGHSELKLNPSNCVHCKTCDIADPYQIITWVPPEGGGGPNYLNM